MSAEINETSEWDGARFGREEGTGVVMGLDIPQCVFIGVGAAVAVIVVIFNGFPVGFVLGLVIAAASFGIGFPRVGGKSLISWAGIFIRLWLRRRQGQNEYVRPIASTEAHSEDDGTIVLGAAGPQDYDTVDGVGPEAGPRRNKKNRIVPEAGKRLYLPGEMNELRLFQLPGGGAFVYDPRRKEAVISAQVMTERALELDSFDRMEDRLRAWAGGLTSISQIPGVERLQFSDQTTIVSGELYASWYEHKRMEAPLVEIPETGEMVRQSGPEIDPFLDSSLMSLMHQAEGQSVHEQWMSVVLSRERLANEIRSAGGGIRGFMDVTLNVMSAVEDSRAVPESGTQIVRWHTPRSLGQVVRSAFDPGSSMSISDRVGADAGVAPESAGPMHANWTHDRMISDGALHRSFVLSEWPRSEAKLGFLEKFIFVGEFRHTVSLYVKPRNTRKALSDNQRRKADFNTNDNIRRRTGRQQSELHDRQLEDIQREEGELVRGMAGLKVAAVITVSGFDEHELDSHSSDLYIRAAEAGCEIRVLSGEQENGFIAGATPLGRLVL